MIKDYQTGYYFDKISNRAIRKKQAKNFDDAFYQKYNNLTLDEYAFVNILKMQTRLVVVILCFASCKMHTKFNIKCWRTKNIGI